MLKSAITLSSVLIVGVLLGLSMTFVDDQGNLVRTVSETVSEIDETTIVDPVAENNNTKNTIENESATTQKQELVLQAPSLDLTSLQAQLLVESTARRKLEVQVNELNQTLQQLQQELNRIARPQTTNRSSRNNRLIDQNTFIEVGFSPEDADFLAQQINQRDLDLLYLRDQAIREDWLDSERYEEEVAKLRAATDTVIDQLDPDEYDRYLLATGRPNRVVVNSVIGNSTGQAIGLQPGDRIIDYNGNRIFNLDDLRSATSANDLDDYVAMHVDREGQIIEYNIPTGPIGVRIRVDSIMP